MARLSDNEKQQLLEAARRPPSVEPKVELFVKSTPETRARYIAFATEASRFFKGENPLPFKGENWKL